jgi:hypothetical protein
MRMIPKVLAVVTLPLPMAGCVLDLNKLAKDIAKPSVSFEQPTAWACDQSAKLPTKQGIEECTVGKNATRTCRPSPCRISSGRQPGAKRVSLSLDGRGRRPGGAAMRRLLTMVALLALVGCAGHRPQTITVKLTPLPTLAQPHAWLAKGIPRRTARPISMWMPTRSM